MIAETTKSPAEILRDYAGARVSRKCRKTGTVVTLYDGKSTADFDTDAGRWQTVCEDHGHIIAHENYQTALSWLSHPDEWCDVCMGNEPNLNL